MADLALELYESVKDSLKDCTRIQALAMAVLGLERMWQVFLDWTKNESAPCLQRPPKEFRAPRPRRHGSATGPE